ncbi:MAG: acetylglutamate kinase [Saccharofermentanales bacterium]|jgi:acetylglutamate kinase
MNYSNEERANILVQALPYFQSYNNKIIVVKYGGNAMIKEYLIDSTMHDIVLLSLIGVKVVLVHGGGIEINEALTRMNIQSKFVNGLRVTDDETMRVVQMVLAGKVNKDLVNLIHTKGGKAIGLSGIDGHMIKASIKDPSLGYVGKIEEVNVRPILDVIEKGYIPVISTIGCDAQGNTYNINADTAAAKIAGELGAESLITMTDIGGILRDQQDPSSIIPVVTLDDVEQLVADQVITGGMLPKVECCTNALHWGVNKVFIIDGRVPHSLLIETLTDSGIGTMFVKEK